MFLKSAKNESITFGESSVIPTAKDTNDDDGDNDDGNGGHHGYNQIHVGHDVHYGVLNTAGTAVIVVSAIGNLSGGRKGTCKKQ